MDYNEMLAIAYEIEGLLHVLDNKKNVAPAVVVDALKLKAQALADAVAQLEATSEPALNIVSEPELPPEQESLAAPEPATEPEYKPEIEPVIDSEPNVEAKDFIAIEDDELPLRGDEDEDHEIFGSQDYVEPAKVSTTTPVDKDEEAKPTMRVDEKLQRSLSQDLRKAFSINDRFRFRRELFGNSDVTMNDALAQVEHMSTVAEAEQYFYGTLGWSRDNTDVQDFMNVIVHHLS